MSICTGLAQKTGKGGLGRLSKKKDLDNMKVHVVDLSKKTGTRLADIL